MVLLVGDLDGFDAVPVPRRQHHADGVGCVDPAGLPQLPTGGLEHGLGQGLEQGRRRLRHLPEQGSGDRLAAERHASAGT